jgi:hypothetical protein
LNRRTEGCRGGGKLLEALAVGKAMGCRRARQLGSAVILAWWSACFVIRLPCALC